MEKKLTDEEVVKALECCTVDEVTDCENCPLLRESCAIIRKYALGLINRQKAEIERLTEENGYLDGCSKQFLADYQKCEIERAELQKQVGELKLELQGQFDKGVKAGCLMSKVKEQQAVKDTAKDLLIEFNEWINGQYDAKFDTYCVHIPVHEVNDFLTDKAKEYGVGGE